MTYRTTCRLALCLVFLGLLGATPCLAGNGSVVQLPPLGAKNKSGLKIEIDSRGVDTNGYRPIKVKLTSSTLTPATYDRQVRVTLELMGWSSYGRIAVSQVLEIPEGATGVEKTISIPCDSRSSYMQLEVTEGGERLPELCHNMTMISVSGGYGGDERFPAILFIDDHVPRRKDRDSIIAAANAQLPDKTPTYTVPDFRNIHAALHDANPSPGIGAANAAASDRSLLALAENAARMEMLPCAELPQRWIDLSGYSIAFISRGDLQKLNQTEPARMEALRQWLNTGTVLVVYDAGDDFQHLQEIEKLLQLAPRPDTEKPATPYHGWQPPSLAQFGTSSKSYGSSSQYYGRVAYATPVPTQSSTAETLDNTKSGPPKPGDKPPFVSRPAHFGWLVAVRAKQPFPGRQDHWEWLLQSIPDQRESWTSRHGMSLDSRNDGFWNWHIPGVGAAPVFGFLLLGTLFAVIIGPLNYLLLGRMQRLYLLLLTVPAGATLVTLSLFLYALATDGLGVRSRVRSLTMIDQRTGQMASWSRQTYFASIAPSRGLNFPDDTTVFQLEQRADQRVQHYRAIDWERDGQRLKSGFIASRSLVQFMVLRSAKSDSKLKVTQAKGAVSSVENGLGARAQLIVLRDGQGSYFWLTDLEKGTSAPFAAIEMADARKRLNELIQQREPEFPQGYDPTNSGNAITRMFGGPWTSGGTSVVSTHASLLEKSLAQIESPTQELLDPGTYWAIVDICPDVPMGVAGTKQQESLHVIHGRY